VHIRGICTNNAYEAFDTGTPMGLVIIKAEGASAGAIQNIKGGLVVAKEVITAVTG